MRRRTRILSAVLGVLALVWTTACSGGAGSPGTAAAPRVALILGGVANDKGYNEIAADAVTQLQREHVITPQVRESVTNPADAEPVLRQYASSGYDLVIGWGLGFSDAVFRVAGQFPGTHFVATGGNDIIAKSTANVETWTYDDLQYGYLLGFIAGSAHLSPVAVVDGEQQPFNQAQWAGFDQGLHAADPAAKLLPAIYTGSWDDAQKAQRATATQIGAGARLVATEASAYSPGVAAAAADGGIATIGLSPSTSPAARRVNIGRIDTSIVAFLRDWVDRAKTGRFGHHGVTSTITNKSFVPADITKVAAAPQLPADIDQRVAALAARLASGQVKITPWTPGK